MRSAPPWTRSRPEAQSQRQGAGRANGGGYAAPGGYGGSSYGGGDSYGAAAAPYRERREREIFDAVCADCGKTARVPFRPSGARPVYCSDCFQTRR